MHLRRTAIWRRSVALALAYLLAVHVILLSWAVAAPGTANLSAAANASLCANYAGAGSDQPGQMPIGCHCGPFCSMAGCGGCGVLTAQTVQMLEYPSARAAAPMPDANEIGPQRVALGPRQARAPPVMA